MSGPRNRSNAIVPFRTGPPATLGGYGVADANLLARINAPTFGEGEDDFLALDANGFPDTGGFWVVERERHVFWRPGVTPSHEYAALPTYETPEFQWGRLAWHCLLAVVSGALFGLACCWSFDEFTGWFRGDDPPAATHSGELVARLENQSCVVDAWGSAGSGKGGRFPALLDSGNSTGGMTLTRADATTAGLDVESLWFVFPYRSMSGLGWEAHTSLRQLRIGGAVLRNVPVDVISETGGVDTSLIGFTLLKRLHFRMRGDSCVLSW